jgi:RHS repeat-associated protein
MNTPAILGRQTFDGLGRQLTVEAAGHITRYHYTDNQLPPTANTLADGKRVEFTYEKALNNKLLSVTPQGEPAQCITYHPLGMPASANGALGIETFGLTTSGQPEQDSWTVDDATHITHWQYSMNGLLQGFTDPQGTLHQRTLDIYGRVEETRVGNATTQYRCDGLSRPVKVIVSESDTGRTLSTSLTYDSCGREHTRTFLIINADDGVTRIFTQTLTYSALDQITSRIWAEGEVRGEETFEYDIRGRLTRYAADEMAAPEDPFGNRIVSQVFTFNAFNGHEQVVTTFADGSEDDARFTYAEHNPVQLVKVSHTHKSWPHDVTLTYDTCGRVINDSLGREMVWNAQDRLIEVRHAGKTCRHGYTAHGRLADRIVDGTLTRSFFSGDELTHDQSGDNSLHYHGGEQGLFAVSKLTDGIRQTTLLGSDAQGSVRLEADSTVRTRHYSAYGVERQNDQHVPFGYAGQRREPLTGWQILGDYRPYDPVLMCFLSPDSESPFGSGGINPYAYCAGDPVNRIDPDGHSWVSYALAGIGIALAAVALVPGLQIALPAAGTLLGSGAGMLTTAQIAALAVATLDVVSLATGVAGMALELAGHDQTVAGVLGGISLVTGLASGGVGFKLASRGWAAARRRALDIKNGWTPSKPTRLGQSTRFVTDSSDTVHVGVIENYLGTHHTAVLTHGDPLRPLLMGLDGKPVRARDFARDLIAPLAENLENKGHSVVLLSCWSGKNGAALEFARELGRPVQGFGRKTFVKGFTNLQTPRSTANIPTEATSLLERLRASGNPLTALKTTYREARPTFYYPDGTTIAF